MPKSSIKKKSIKKSIKKGIKKSIKKSIKRTPYEYMSFMDSEENRLLEKKHNCGTKYCSKEYGEKDKYTIIYDKEHDIACPSNLKGDAFFKCSSEIYDKSDLPKMWDNITKCNKKHCEKYSQSLRKYRDKIIFKELNIPQTIGKLLISK